jgi:hypothetical protein
LLASVHIAVACAFGYFVIRYYAARPGPDLASLFAVASFALAWGIAASRRWAILLHVGIIALLVPIFIGGHGVVQYGAMLGEPMEMDVTMLVHAVTPHGFYPVMALLACFEAGSLALLIFLYWAMGGIGDRVARMTSWFLYLEIAAIVPLAFFVLMGEVVAPAMVHSIYRSQKELRAADQLSKQLDEERQKIRFKFYLDNIRILQELRKELVDLKHEHFAHQAKYSARRPITPIGSPIDQSPIPVPDSAWLEEMARLTEKLEKLQAEVDSRSRIEAERRQLGQRPTQKKPPKKQSLPANKQQASQSK